MNECWEKRDAVDVIKVHSICCRKTKAPIGYIHLWMVNCPAHAYERVINNIWIMVQLSFFHPYFCFSLQPSGFLSSSTSSMLKKKKKHKYLIHSNETIFNYYPLALKKVVVQTFKK